MQGFTLTTFMLVGLGGALGSMLRYATSVTAIGLFGVGFPWGTLAVNLVGSFIIGLLAGFGLEGQARHLVVVGFLGGFTTFSSFSLEATMLWDRSPVLSASYVAASIVLGGATCMLGVWLFRR